MKKIFAGVIVAGFSLGAFAGSASADGHGGNNGVLCSYQGGLPANEVDNPAALFAWFSDRGNPVEVLETFTVNTGWTVGDWIKNRCEAGK